MYRILVVLLVWLSLLVPAQASASVPAPLVVFGDSVVADPPVLDYLAGKAGLPGRPECPASASNYGVLAARQLGLPAADFSCSGTTSTGTRSLFGGPDFSRQVNRALAAGTDFLDLKASTAGQGMCAPNGVRFWSAVIDDSPGNLPFHLNAAGHRHVAEVIARS